MEEKELAYYIEDLNRIHDLSLEKLGEWKEKYPYSQIVHFLMAKKHQVEGFVEDMSVYHKASFYAVDRQYLHERMTASELESEEVSEEVLEQEVSVGDREEDGDDLETFDVIDDFIEEQVITSKEVEIAPLNTEKLSDFANWVLSLGDMPPSAVAKKKKKKKKKKSKLEKKIENSVVKKEEIISETLANILAQQGHNSQAREMYQKLSLIFPEKSSFFADQIEKLK